MDSNAISIPLPRITILVILPQILPLFKPGFRHCCELVGNESHNFYGFAVETGGEHFLRAQKRLSSGRQTRGGSAGAFIRNERKRKTAAGRHFSFTNARFPGIISMLKRRVGHTVNQRPEASRGMVQARLETGSHASPASAELNAVAFFSKLRRVRTLQRKRSGRPNAVNPGGTAQQPASRFSGCGFFIFRIACRTAAFLPVHRVKIR